MNRPYLALSIAFFAACGSGSGSQTTDTAPPKTDSIAADSLASDVTVASDTLSGDAGSDTSSIADSATNPPTDSATTTPVDSAADSTVVDSTTGADTQDSIAADTKPDATTSDSTASDTVVADTHEAAVDSADTTDSAVTGKYILGADVTDQEPQSTTTRANLLTILKAHGFNWIRLRTFVDPKAADGYDKTNGYDDLTHTIAFAAQVKAAGMGFLLDFHYSDNWADPGKQCIPVAWQAMNATQMAQAVHDYTNNAITQLIAGGARPDMVQVGNEITPGMLIHICDANGQPTSTNAVNGGNSSNFTNLGSFLKAGINGIHEVDSTITIMLHIDQGGDGPGKTAGSALSTNKWWIGGVQGQGVVFDVMGESSYQAYQGDPNSTANTQATWTSTFGGIATAYPNLKLVAAEYGPMERQINDVVYDLANDQGMGTFDWEPTTEGAWNTGHNLLVLSGTTYTVQPDMALFDQMMTAYASRL